MDNRDIVIDLSHVRKIDSMSLAAVLRLKNLLTQDGRRLNLTNPGSNVIKILEISGLDSILLD
jgi:anti-anti-sigma factor